MLRMAVGTTVSPMNEQPFDLPAGFQDFPDPDSL